MVEQNALNDDNGMTANDLEQQLAEKEELVSALTQQLEQAAEQLDRMQRTGGITRSRNEVDLSKVDFSNSQLGRDVGYLVEQWDQAEIPLGFQRMEARIDELREMLSGLQFTSASQMPAEMYSPHQAEYSGHDENSATSDDEQTGDELFASLQAALSNSSQQIPDEEYEASPEDHSHFSPLERYSAENHCEESEPTDLHVPTDVPPEVDFDRASEAELIDAVKQRDDFIEQLLCSYRDLHKQSGLVEPINWDLLADCPVELEERLAKLEKHLEDQARINEVTMSLERARLTRESTQLSQARVQLQKYVKKHGLDPNEIPGFGEPGAQKREARVEADERKKSAASSQKWISMLRIKNQSDRDNSE